MADTQPLVKDHPTPGLPDEEEVEAKKGQFTPYHDLNQPIGAIWIESVECFGVVPLSTDPLNLTLKLEGASLENRFYPAAPTKLADSLQFTVTEPTSTQPKYLDLLDKKASKAWFIFPDTACDSTIQVTLEIRQKKSGKIAKLLGDKAIASSCFSLFEVWEELQKKPEGIVVEKELSAPKVNPEFEAINAPTRSTDKARVVVKLKYDKMRDIESPIAQLAKVPMNFITRKTFLAPSYFRGTGTRDHALNLHSARLAAEAFLNEIIDKIQLINIESVSVVDEQVSDSVVLWFKKVK